MRWWFYRYSWFIISISLRDFSLSPSIQSALMTANMWHYPLLFMSNQFKSPIVLFASASFQRERAVAETTCVMLCCRVVGATAAAAADVIVASCCWSTCWEDVFYQRFCSLAVVKRSSSTVFASDSRIDLIYTADCWFISMIIGPDDDNERHILCMRIRLQLRHNHYYYYYLKKSWLNFRN